MRYGKALEEVWEWRKELSKELEGLSPKEQIKYLNEKARKSCMKYGIKCKEPSISKIHT